MRHFEVSVPYPIEPDKKLAATFDKLNGQVSELASKRRTVMASLAPVSPLYPNPPAELAELEAEYSLLKAEIPIWKQLPEFIEQCRKSRQSAVMVADEIVSEARNYVRSIFDRDYDPATWPVREPALAHYINSHPVVLGAMDRYAEINSSDEGGMREAVEQTLQAAEQKYKQLPPMIAQAAERVQATAYDAARREADKKREHDLAVKRSAELEATRKRAADEARRRLTAAK